MKEQEQLQLRQELSKIDFSKLNDLLAQEMDSYYVNSYEKIIELAEIVLSGRKVVHYDEPEYKGHFSPNEVIDFVAQFFYDINPFLCNLFYDKLYEVKDTKKGTNPKCQVHFVIKDSSKEKKTNCIYADGTVSIALDGTTKAAIVTVHEMTHKFTVRANKWGVIYLLLAETPAVTMEFLLYDYIKRLYEEGKISKTVLEDIKKFIEWRFARTILHARALLMNCELIRLYKINNNHIDETIIFEYLTTLDTNSLRNTLIKVGFLKCLEDLKDTNYQELKYLRYIRYVLCLLIACDFHIKINRDAREIESLFKLNDIVGKLNDSFEEDLKTLKEIDLKIFKDINHISAESSPKSIIKNEDIIILDEESSKRFALSYRKSLENLFGKSKI